MIPPASLEDITIRYKPDLRLLTVDGPEEARVLCMVMENMLPDYLHIASNAILQHTAASCNDFQFRYPREAVIDVGEPLWEGVELSIWNGEVDTIQEAAFELAMLRMFHVFIEAAMASSDPIVGTTRWQTLLQNAARIEERAEARE